MAGVAAALGGLPTQVVAVEPETLRRFEPHWTHCCGIAGASSSSTALQQHWPRPNATTRATTHQRGKRRTPVTQT